MKNKVILVIMGIAAVLTPLLIIIGKVVTSVGAIAGAMGKVIPLIAKLKPEEELGQYTVLVQATEKPYTITLKFNSTHDTTQQEDGNKWETEVIKYSTAIMGLIDNVAQVNWEFPSDENKIEGSFFNRADAEKLMKLGVPISEFAKTPEAVQLLLNQLGIDLY